VFNLDDVVTMRVTKVETIVLSAPHPRKEYWGARAWAKDYRRQGERSPDLEDTYPLRWRMRHYWSSAINTCLVKVTTDDGIIGYGESKAVIAPEMIKLYIDKYLSKLIIGEDPFYTRVLWDRMQASMRGRGHIQGFHQEAAAGIDIALWDIKGRATGRPIVDLLGGKYRDRIRVYYSSLPGVQDVDNEDQSRRLADEARLAIDKGFNAVKIAIGFGFKADIKSVDIVRETLGSDILIVVDALGSYDYTQALRLSELLAEKGVGWLEAPLATDDFDGYVRLSQRSPIYIANDLVWTSGIVADMLSRGAKMIVQPEVIKVGITECQRIAEIADEYGSPYAPHVSIGSAIEFASTVHLAASAPNFIISEYWAGENPLGNQILKKPLEFNNGFLVVPSAPGLGVEVDLSRIKEFEQTSVSDKIIGIDLQV
jgi:D-galactarolactone cycloisomerase